MNLVVLYGCQGADTDAEQLALTEQILDAALGELGVVAGGQPSLIVGGKVGEGWLGRDTTILHCTHQMHYHIITAQGHLFFVPYLSFLICTWYRFCRCVSSGYSGRYRRQ